MDTPQQLPVEAARKQFAELLNGSQFRGEHTEITRHGKAAGYLVPPDWYERAKQALTQPIGAPEPRERPSPLPGVEPRDLVAELTVQQAADLAGRAFVKADPRQYQALTKASADGDHAVVAAALDLGLLSDKDLLAA